MRRITTGLVVAFAGLTAGGIAIAQISTSVPTPQPRSGSQPNVFAPGWTATPVAAGSDSLENATGEYARYGYVSDAATRGDGLDTKSEPDQNTYLTTATNPGGPTAGYDYGRHFLIQGHEIFSGADSGNPGVPIKKAYLTRVNLDVTDPAHHITLINQPTVPTGTNAANPSTTGIQSIDGSTYDPWTKDLLFTAEDGANGGVIGTQLNWASTSIPPITRYNGSMGQAGYEGIHNDDRGNVLLVEDVGGSAVTDNGATTNNVKQPNSFIYRFKPTTPGDLTAGVLQALQVKVDGAPITFHNAATTSLAAARDDALGDPIRRLHSGERLTAAWVTIHDTATSTTAFAANAAAKAASATPFKRPENGKFIPGTDFKSFVFAETGDTDNTAGNYVSPVDGAKAADRGSWGALVRIDMPESGADTGTVHTVLNGDASHASFDNIAMLDSSTALVTEDRGDGLHKQLSFLDSLWSFDLNKPLDQITTDGKRLQAQGRDVDSFADVQKKEGTPVVPDHNDGDNEVTGIHVSAGSVAIGGVLGSYDPAKATGTRIFVTQQHGSNVTYELTPPADALPTGPQGPAGAAGAAGATGAAGAAGPAGEKGATGATGANGTPGIAGTLGAQGPAGKTGKTGKAGKNGKNATVSCKLAVSKKKITCSVRYLSTSHRAAGARLVRGGRTVARGTLVNGHVTLTGKHALPRGAYSLVAAGRVVRLTVR